jgi:hypothetical protein
VLEEIAAHPEITLARRDILRFILVEPSKRSEEVQAILKLEGIGQMRAALNTAQNKLQIAEKSSSIGNAVLGYVPRNLTLKRYAIKPFDVRANLEAD